MIRFETRMIALREQAIEYIFQNVRQNEVFRLDEGATTLLEVISDDDEDVEIVSIEKSEQGMLWVGYKTSHSIFDWEGDLDEEDEDVGVSKIGTKKVAGKEEPPFIEAEIDIEDLGTAVICRIADFMDEIIAEEFNKSLKSDTKS